MSAHLCLIAWNEPIGRSELHAHLRVLDRHVEHELRAADHLVGESDRGLVERLAQRGPTGTRLPSGVAFTPENSRRACFRVWSIVASAGAGEARGVAVDGEERDAVGARRPGQAGDHDDEVRGGDRRSRTSSRRRARTRRHRRGLPS